MSTDDEDLKKISRLLEVGATMLADHCTECGAPLFRYHGEVMCPLCSNPTNTAPQGMGQAQPKTQSAQENQHIQKKQHDVSTEPAPIHVKHITQPSVPSMPSTPTVSLGEQSTLEDVIQTKISEIATSMSQEGDLHKIKEQLECIEQGVRVLKLLR